MRLILWVMLLSYSVILNWHLIELVGHSVTLYLLSLASGLAVGIGMRQSELGGRSGGGTP